MKRLLTIIMALIFCIAFAGCSLDASKLGASFDQYNRANNEIEHTWIVNSNTGTFHFDESCSAVKRMNESNKKEMVESFEYMEEHYHPCGICKPWLKAGE